MAATQRSRTKGQVRSQDLGAGERLRGRGAWLKLSGRWIMRRSPLERASRLGVVVVQLLGLDEAAARGVEVEELGVAAPVDGGFELAQGLFFAELLVEHVVEELFGDAAVALGLDGADDLPEQQDVFDGGGAEELLLAQDLGVGVLRAGGRDGGVAFVDREEAEQLGGVDDGQQVVDLEGEVVGQPVDVVLAVVVEQRARADRRCRRDARAAASGSASGAGRGRACRRRSAGSAGGCASGCVSTL